MSTLKNSNSNTTLKNVYLLFTPAGKAEVNVLLEKRENRQLYSQRYDFENGSPIQMVSKLDNEKQVTSKYSILTDGDQRTYVLVENDPAHPTKMLLVPHIFRSR